MTERHAPSRRSILAALGAVPLAGGLLAIPGATANADESSGSGRIPDELRPGGKLDELAARLAAEDTFSGTVLLTHRGRPVLRRSHQMADKSRGIPNGPDTIFTLASITKMFTAVAIAQLVEKGELVFTDTVGTYVDGLAPDVQKVTVHQLLIHTSGLGNFQSQAYHKASRTWKSVEENWEGTFEFVRECTLEFSPGSSQTYSNAGFFLLGAIIARVVAGKPAAPGQVYYDYVREHVFKAADMVSSDFYTLPERLESRTIAHNYARDRETGELFDNTENFGFIGLPPGESHSNAQDLVNFTKALRENRLLKRPFTHILTTPKLPTPPKNSGYEAYGIDMLLLNDQWVLGHNGGSTGGVACQVDWFPDTDWVVVVLGNYGDHSIKSLVDLARDVITGNGGR